jgi:Mrp family chromosome partitioning ATPase
MSRIFEALKKAGSLPFPPVESAPLRPPPMTRPAPATAAAGRATALEPAITLRIETRPALLLLPEVMRQMTALRVGLESALEDRKCRVVMFLGPMGGEGVTTIATQFASALAAEGRGPSLLLDVRAPRPPSAGPAPARPAAAPARSAPLPPARGADGAPSGRAPLSVAALGGDPKSAGSRAPGALRAALERLTDQFEWVVVDGPPVLEAPESVDFGPLVDGVVLVVRSGHTKRPVALRAAEMLRKSGVRVLGSVLNRRHLEIPDFIYRRI